MLHGLASSPEAWVNVANDIHGDARRRRRIGWALSTFRDALRETLKDNRVLEGTDIDREDERLNRLLNFAPMPQVEHAILIAAPHQGTPFATNRLSRWTANLVRVPLALQNEIAEVMGTGTNIGPEGRTFHVPNSIELLREADTVIRATSQLPISRQVRFHLIIARRRESGPLEDSTMASSSARLSRARCRKR
ncbi:hypothetical protein QF000_001652 [Paraburkholderia atlantica]|uniref:hypothetical protein n=1 Tax=Paraburkholderia atlantica TaxID=2654982 RepID=UPI00128D1D95|nr:hypothetical protein [Paraburkholderia atlantica]MBB5414485.1 hypothetical protein [Paraburkholderia atlantica]MPW07896.1 hypothetical protein [Paraburkholderia atlantica]NUY29000.1 hypothetical protein [Paraburkholderia atlantica]